MVAYWHVNMILVSRYGSGPSFNEDPNLIFHLLDENQVVLFVLSFMSIAEKVQGELCKST